MTSYQSLTNVDSFCNDIQRLAGPGYVPSSADIIQLSKLDIAISEIQIKTGGQIVNFVHYPDTDVRKLYYQFDKVLSVLFMVRLASYADCGLKNRNISHMLEIMEQFQLVCRSPYFAKSSVLLFFDLTGLEQTLQRVPLESQYPRYTGGNDVSKAAAFLVKKFQTLNRNKLRLHSILANPTEPKTIQSVLGLIRETVMENFLGFPFI